MAASPTRIKRIAFAISIATAAIAGALLIVIQPVEPSVGREYIGRVFAICVLGGLGSLPGTLIGAMMLGVLESFTATFYGPSWAPAVVVRRPAAGPGIQAVRPVRTIGGAPCEHPFSSLICVAVAAARFRCWCAGSATNITFFAGYVVLQFVVLATAWNILGGYTGYVNFGSAAFFAVGAYATIFFHKTFPLPIPVLIVIGGVLSGAIGLGMGYLTLRLRGAFFAIGTLALAVVLQTIVTNWTFLGGARGAYVLRPNEIAVHRSLHPVPVPADARH